MIDSGFKGLPEGIYVISLGETASHAHDSKRELGCLCIIRSSLSEVVIENDIGDSRGIQRLDKEAGENSLCEWTNRPGGCFRGVYGGCTSLNDCLPAYRPGQNIVDNMLEQLLRSCDHVELSFCTSDECSLACYPRLLFPFLKQGHGAVDQLCSIFPVEITRRVVRSVDADVSARFGIGLKSGMIQQSCQARRWRADSDSFATRSAEIRSVKLEDSLGRVSTLITRAWD